MSSQEQMILDYVNRMQQQQQMQGGLQQMEMHHLQQQMQQVPVKSKAQSQP